MKETLNRRTELADFLKNRRARLHPEQFGLPTVSRRRTPGLRRDEIAQLVGVGVSWYTWLEQGRDIHVSEQLLERLAQVLQLDWGERRHLFVLARGLVPVPNGQENEMMPPKMAYQAVLDALGICPAYLLDQHLNVVAWNESTCRVFGDFSRFSEQERNMVWFLFLHPAARKLFIHWERSARWSLASLRAKSDQYADEEWFIQFVTDLKHASSRFRVWWEQHDIQLTCDSVKELNHPLVGRLVLQATTFNVPQGPELQMVVHTPLLEENTVTKLNMLMATECQSPVTG